MATAAAVVPGWLSWAAVGVMVLGSFIAAGALLLIGRPSPNPGTRHPFAPALALGWITALALALI
ncbi:MAG: hypothetical protein ACRD0U_07685 [Acidimicrobiales bacterium]